MKRVNRWQITTGHGIPVAQRPEPTNLALVAIHDTAGFSEDDHVFSIYPLSLVLIL